MSALSLGDNLALLHRGGVVGGVKAGPITKSEARKAVLDVWARAGKKNFGVPVEIKDTVDDLPDDLRAQAVAQGCPPGGNERFFSTFHDGTVYILASEHRTAQEIEKTLHHEVYGHEALNTLMGGELHDKTAMRTSRIVTYASTMLRHLLDGILTLVALGDELVAVHIDGLAHKAQT